ncbi:MAG TPA: AAA family ATPase [Usitatibacter sp.]|nr:AAA family ATPase [Usitatibacter sp.]
MSAILHEAGIEALADELLDPAAYPHPAARIERHETHISLVFLAGDYAYKVKKAVRLPFLDFTSLSERYYYCREEVRLNRRTAPELYLDVVPIAGRPARVAGRGPVRDYAVRMRRFREEALLSRRARQGRLDPATIDRLSDEVARFHGAAALAGERDDYGSLDRVKRPALDNFAEMQALSPPAALAAALEPLRDWTRREAHDLAPRFEQRKSGGFVRECHGDLHLGNVVMVDGAPRLFDCIEFSAGMRWIDVMSDVAFAFVDLVHHGQGRLAWRFLDRYLETTGDYSGLAVFRFYAVYRALVRAKVALIRARQESSDGAARQRCEEDAAAYVALAERLSRREPPEIMLMHGFSGSGKTTASQRLLEALGAVRLRSDVERKRLHGLPALARATHAPGQGIYGAEENDRTYARLALLAQEVLEAGYPVVVDATFLDRRQRERFRDIARESRAAFELVSCVAPEPVLRQRIELRGRGVADASDAHASVLERQIAGHHPLCDEEMVHTTLLDTTTDREWRRAVESLARRFRLPMQAS